MMVVLTRYRDGRMPSQRELAVECGVSVKTASRSLVLLESIGYISRSHADERSQARAINVIIPWTDLDEGVNHGKAEMQGHRRIIGQADH